MLASCDHDMSKVQQEEGGDGIKDTSGKVDLGKEWEHLSPSMVRKKENKMEVKKEVFWIEDGGLDLLRSRVDLLGNVDKTFFLGEEGFVLG